jgi:hypothetical protein
MVLDSWFAVGGSWADFLKLDSDQGTSIPRLVCFYGKVANGINISTSKDRWDVWSQRAFQNLDG